MQQGKISTIVGVILIGVAFLFAAGIWMMQRTGSAIQERETTSPSLSDLRLAPEVEAVLDRKIFLVEGLLRDPAVIEAVREANEQHKDITFVEIQKLDQKWQEASEGDDYVESFLSNELARILREFQEDNAGFSEIFVTDVKGLNVGQTNRTTDFYQADEEWWVLAYQGGTGKASHGSIEFDESAQAEAISLYVPVIDPETNEAIGVAKAVVSIAAIKLEL